MLHLKSKRNYRDMVLAILILPGAAVLGACLIIIATAMLNLPRAYECNRSLERGYWIDNVVDHYNYVPQYVTSTSYVNGKTTTTSEMKVVAVPVYKQVRSDMTFEQYKEMCVTQP
jgi:hypothetical protein